MLYRDNPRNGDRLSQLGLGCMRFPRRGNQVDQEQTTALVRAAIERGVNYFDTAYIYPGSEEALGRALAEIGARDRVKIATKLPIITCRRAEDFDRFFDKALSRLQTDHIDYYFMHMLCDRDAWARLISLGILPWIARKRAAGQIRNLGFSFHGGREAFAALLGAYDWDFCMVQFNYLDENNQAGYGGVRLAHEKGLPVFVMEPLRGGYLAGSLSDDAQAIFRAANPNRSMADWGLRWVWNHPEVTLLLSGMSDLAQLGENVATAQTATPGHLSPTELAVYPRAISVINRSIKVPCTGCGYCQPCPAGVDIPTCFAGYNETYARGHFRSLSRYYMTTGVLSAQQHDASRCTRCGKCEAHCPQHIEIPKALRRVRRRMFDRLCLPACALLRLATGQRRAK